jgi:hypothetical protein
VEVATLHQHIRIGAAITITVLTTLSPLPRSDAQSTSSELSGATTLSRDARAVEVIKGVLSALSIGGAAPIRDYKINGTIESEQGFSSGRPIELRGIGATSSSAQLTLHDGVHTFTVQGAEGLHTGSSGTKNYVPASIALEESPYFFIPLMEDAITDPEVGATLVDNKAADGFDISLRIERRDPHWVANKDYLMTGFLTLYINPTTYHVDAIVADARTTQHIQKTNSHYFFYSDYRPELGWLVPHTIKESVANQLHLEITLTSFTFNTGMSSHLFDIK